MAAPEAGTDTRGELRAAGIVAAASLLAGIPLGVAWWLLAPVARLAKRADGVFAVGTQTETAVAADGWFAICAVVAGVLAGIAAAFLLREHRLGALAGLAVGGLLGSLVAWRLGALLGPASIEAAADGLRNGARFDGPLRVSAKGVLLVWSTSAVVVFFAAVAGLDSSDRDERRISGQRPPDGFRGPPPPDWPASGY